MAVPRWSVAIPGACAGFVTTLALLTSEPQIGVSVQVNSLSLSDILVVVAGLVLSMLTAIAGVLVVADVRAEYGGTTEQPAFGIELYEDFHDWRPIATSQFDPRYVTGIANAEHLKILLAHRVGEHPFIEKTVTKSPPMSGGHFIDDRNHAPTVDLTAIAGLGSTSLAIVPTIVRSVRANSHTTASLGSGVAGTRHNALGLQQADRRVNRLRRIANARPGWIGSADQAWASHNGWANGITAHVVVWAADDDGQVRRQLAGTAAPNITTPAQPGCRGPPTGDRGREAPDSAGSARLSEGEKLKPRLIASATDADSVVSDNLGGAVPVAAAELDVIERYLDELLGELLADPGARTDAPTT